MVDHSGHQGFGEWTSECRVMASVFPSESNLGLSSLIISQGSRKLMEKEKKRKVMWLILCLPCDASRWGSIGSWLYVSWLEKEGSTPIENLGMQSFREVIGFLWAPPAFCFWAILLSFIEGQQHEWKLPTTCTTMGKSFTALDPTSLFFRLQSRSWQLHELCPLCVTFYTIVFQWAKFLFQ